MTNTRTQIPREINNYYDRVLLKRLLPYFQFLKFAQIRDIPRRGGTDTIRFRRYSNLAAATTPLTEGVTPTGTTLAVTEVTATVAQYGAFVTISDVINYESPDAVLTETAELLADQAKDTLDLVARDILTAGTTVQFSETAGGVVAAARNQVADPIRVATILKAVRTLQNNRAKKITKIVNPDNGYNTSPINASFVGIVGPAVLFNLKQLPGWVPVQNYANKADVMEGEEGALDNVRFILSENTRVFVGAGAVGADVHTTLIFGQEAYGMTKISGEGLKNIIHPLGSAGSADALNQRATSGWKVTFVARILNELSMVRIETTATL